MAALRSAAQELLALPGRGVRRWAAAINEWTAARGHANVVLVDARQRLEQGNARPRICLPQDPGKVPAVWARVVNRPGRASLGEAQNGPAISASW